MSTIRSRTYKVLKRWSTAKSVLPITQTVCDLWDSGDKGDAVACTAEVRKVLIRMLKAEFTELTIALVPKQLAGKKATLQALVSTIISSAAAPSEGKQ